ncbi:MAG: type II toxin-antitoxin system HipA family toxin YjjJ [Deltaproteobacteria bacterium]|nr:type II toxin-antitoxin system HipA family toxin YjjJ [Deltaproteobacteria bacterium]
MPDAAQALLNLLRRRGVATGRDLCQALSISQPTLSRLVERSRDELVVLGRARSVRYAARDQRSAFAAGLPIYRAREDGRIEGFGTVVPLANGQTAHLREGVQPKVFSGLPWFVEELRPDGFLGRLFVKSAPAALQLPPDARRWTSEQLLRALVYGIEDVPGDLLIGRPAFDRHMQRRLGGEPLVARSDYPRLVRAQLAGDAPGSSAAGEQPKFACVTSSGSLLVKYTPPISESPAARRWADLLRCEDLALRVLRSHGCAAAQSEYVEHEGRAYLEVVRFDRTVAGRVGVVSGRYVDAELVGAGAWVPLAEGMAKRRLLAESDADAVRFAHHFGALIGNTDMHLGNIAFFTDDYERFRLAPLYDMLPMALRPNAQGELPSSDAPWAHPTPEDAAVWRRAATVAITFFERVLEERRLDETVRAFADGRMRRTKVLMDTFGRGEVPARPASC